MILITCRFNDLHSLDLTTLTWTKIKISSGVYPPPCDFSTISYYDNNYLIVFGGSNDSLPEQSFNEVRKEREMWLFLWYTLLYMNIHGALWYEMDVDMEYGNISWCQRASRAG